MDILGDIKGDSLAVLEYHRYDDFSNSDGAARIDYYGITGYPTGKVNGRTSIVGGGGGTYAAYRNAYLLEMQVPSPCTLNISVDYDETTRFLKVVSRVTAVDSFENAWLRCAITESHIFNPWQWLDSLHHVVRKMLPNYNGIALPTMNPNDTFVDSQTYTLPGEWKDHNCYVVVFLQQDDLDTSVLRSAKSGRLWIWLFGDVNQDSIVNVVDAVFLVNHVFKNYPPPDLLETGDPNHDCIIDVVDIVYLVNYIFKGGPAPLMGCAQ